MEEKWKSVDNTESTYMVSNLGRVISLNGKHRPKVLSPCLMQIGYRMTQMRVSGIDKKVLIHRLVASAFIPNTENKPQVNHIDGNRSNNAYTNLEWCTKSENELHAYSVLGKKGGMTGKYGANNKKSIPVVRIDRLSLDKVEYVSSVDAAARNGVSESSIARLLHGRIKTETPLNKAFIWKFKKDMP